MTDEIKPDDIPEDYNSSMSVVDRAQISALMARLKKGKPLKPNELEKVKAFQENRAPRRTLHGRDSIASAQDKGYAKQKKIISEARDIAGNWHEAKDINRKESCRKDFQNFCQIYFPEQFTLKFSPDHIRVIKKIERAVLDGGLFAMAMPRGAGKTTIAECASIWAIIYGHRKFIVVIGSDAGSAASMLDSIKTEMETNDRLEEDFWDAVGPIRALDGIPHRAGGQTFKGERTHIGWTADEIVMPSIPGGESSGAVFRVAGITGRIRGMKFKQADGKAARPDFVILDDPQNDESAHSIVQTQARLAVLNGAILGLGGPGKKIAGVMPCTVICPGDMVDQILDSKRHPEWNGERTKMVYSWPKNNKLWEEYARIRADCLRDDRGIIDATNYYRENRDEMDRGSEVAWPERFNLDEISAIQNAMNIRLTNEAAFFAEYQNDPIPDKEATDDGLTADLIASRLSGLAQAALSPSALRITAFIDVQQKSLWWTVVAWSDNCDGWILDYGTFPDQSRAYFTLRDMKVTLAHVVKGAGLEGQIRGGLDALVDDLLERKYLQPSGTSIGIERLLIDANWAESTDTVYEFCRQSKHGEIVIPSHGRYVGASSRPMNDWNKAPGEKVGNNWRVGAKKRGLRALAFDTNSWKSWIASRFLTAPGDPGALTLWGKDRERHRLIADHLTSEHRIRTTGRGRTVDEWKLKPGRDNHWFDGVVGCAVAASVQGMPAAPIRASILAENKGKAPQKPGFGGVGKSDRMSFSALQREAKRRKETPETRSRAV